MVFLETQPHTGIFSETNSHSGHLEGSIDSAESRTTLRVKAVDDLRVDEKGAENSVFASFLRDLPAVLTHEQQVRESAHIFDGQVALQRLVSLPDTGLLSDSQRQRIAAIVESELPCFLLKHFNSQAKADKKRVEQTGTERLAEIEERNAWWKLQIGTIVDMPLSERGIYIDEVIESQKELAVLGQESFNRMVETNLRLCVYVAKFTHKGKMDFEDVVGYGIEGLMIAVARYDYRRGNKFSTYALFWIRQKIERSLSYYAPHIPIPKAVEVKLKQAVDLERRLTQELGRLPTSEELVEAGCDPELVGINLLGRMVSLNQPVGNGDAELGDLFLDENGESPEDEAEINNLRGVLKEAVDKLGPRERKIILLHYGLVNDESMTLAEIGPLVKVSRERARQIEVKALRKLRHYLADFRS